jgi:hypothetical protein
MRDESAPKEIPLKADDEIMLRAGIDDEALVSGATDQTEEEKHVRFKDWLWNARGIKFETLTSQARVDELYCEWEMEVCRGN